MQPALTKLVDYVVSYWPLTVILSCGVTISSGVGWIFGRLNCGRIEAALKKIGDVLWPSPLYLWGAECTVATILICEQEHFWFDPNVATRHVGAAAFCLIFVISLQLVVLAFTRGVSGPTLWRRSRTSWSFVFTILAVFGDLYLFYNLSVRWL